MNKEVALKIVVCVKQVPDSAAKVVVENGQVTWGEAPLVINPWDEFAVEAALVQKETHGGEVTVVSVGEEISKEALKHALAMGCGEAVLISDPALAGADSQAVARVLAAAIQKMGDVDLVFFGRQAIDGDMAVTAVKPGGNGPPSPGFGDLQPDPGEHDPCRALDGRGRQTSRQSCRQSSVLSKILANALSIFHGYPQASRDHPPGHWLTWDRGASPTVKWPDC
jgi:hypothetical protein